MKIAIIGTRGIPAKYGGYEFLAEELAVRLVNIYGMEVTVYCRNVYYDAKPPHFSNVECVYLPSGKIKGLESVIHTGLSILHAITCNYDVIFVVDPANTPFCFLLKFLGKRVVIHTDGLGWKRKKWGRLARIYYKWVEKLTTYGAHALIADNPVIKEYYAQTYHVESVYIPYGAEPTAGVDNTIFKEVRIKPHAYFLVVARLEPENNTAIIIKEYVSSNIDFPLVIVGDAPYGKRYLKQLHGLANENVFFTGRINDQKKLNALYQNAYLYIHGHEVGGTNPSLLRAMGLGIAPLVLNSPFNTVVIGDNGFTFDKKEGNLSNTLKELLVNQELVKEMGCRARAWADTRFTWESVAAMYGELFRSLVEKSSHMSLLSSL
jgi:glycosyltransferase involved in cell wall biosynthesis